MRSSFAVPHGILANGKEPFWINMAAQYLLRAPWEINHRFRAVLHAMMAAAAEGRRLRVIEVGCNRGFIGGLAARLGHDYLGLDLPTRTLLAARADFEPFGARFTAVSPESFAAGMPGSKYDLVFSSEVIEHVPSPRSFCRRILELVDAGGRLIFTTPDLEYRPGELWATALPPIHTVFLRKSSITKVLKVLAPEASIECYNEDLGPADSTPEAAPAEHSGNLRVPVQCLDADPASPGFGYHVSNLGIPIAAVPGRYRPPKPDPARPSLPEPHAHLRKGGSSIIVEVTFAPAALGCES